MNENGLPTSKEIINDLKTFIFKFERESAVDCLYISGALDIIEKELKALEIIKEKKVFVANLIYHFENDDNVLNYNRGCGWAKSELTQKEYDILKEELL